MTLSIVNKAESSLGSEPLVSGSFTPTAGAVLLLGCLSFMNAAGTAGPPTDTFGDAGGTAWTAFTNSVVTTGGAYAAAYAGWARKIGTGPGAGAITIPCSGWAGGFLQLVCDEVTTSAGTLSIAQSNCANIAYSATGSVILGSAPASTSLVWSTGQVGNTAYTPAVTTSGFTALGLTNNDYSVASAYIIGSGPQTVAWDALDGGNNLNFLAAVEVAVSGGGPTNTGFLFLMHR